MGAALLFSFTLAACGDKQPDPPARWRRRSAAAEVAVVTVRPGTVSLSTELPGRLEASRVAQVRARATGILNKRVFTEGSDVRAGQLLYQIDPAPYQAAQQSAQAQLAQAQAQLANASAVVTRLKPLVTANAVSKQEFDAAVAAEKAAQAQVAAGRAAVRTAGINLGYATVTAPISGRIGRSLVTEGALVSAQEGTQLALIQQINPLYINITQSAAEVWHCASLQSGWRVPAAPGGGAALLKRSAARPAARLLFTDLSVDPATGQVSLRAELPNPGGLLLPGMYVRVRLEQAQVDNAILLPQQAVTRGNQGDTGMVVAPDGSVAPRSIKISGAKDQNWIVTEGLQAGEQVMVEGAMKLMLGAKVVKPVPWQPGKPAPRAAQAPASAAASAAAPAAVASAAPAASGPAPAASR